MDREMIRSGIKIGVFRGETKVDDGEVIQVDHDGPYGNQRVLLVSNFADKDEIKTLFYGDGGWFMLFPDPMTDLPCFNPRGPMYDLRFM